MVAAVGGRQNQQQTRQEAINGKAHAEHHRPCASNMTSREWKPPLFGHQSRCCQLGVSVGVNHTLQLCSCVLQVETLCPEKLDRRLLPTLLRPPKLPSSTT